VRVPVQRLTVLGFEFDRHAAGNHEIWSNPGTRPQTTAPNPSGDMPAGLPCAILRQAGIETEESLRQER